MSTIEKINTQKPKIKYEGNRQDHGDASQEKARRFERDARAWDRISFSNFNDKYSGGLDDDDSVSIFSSPA